MKEKLTNLINEYGPIAFGTYIAIFLVSIAGFSLAITMGFEVDGAASTAGLLGAAWVGTKIIQIPRIALTVALTPIVAKVVRRAPREPASGPEN